MLRLALRLTIVSLVISLIAAFFGPAGVAVLSWEGARIVAVVLIVVLAANSRRSGCAFRQKGVKSCADGA
jgi:uncharacterized membrane protein YtjA (UPF0391 family)